MKSVYLARRDPRRELPVFHKVREAARGSHLVWQSEPSLSEHGEGWEGRIRGPGLVRPLAVVSLGPTLSWCDATAPALCRRLGCLRISGMQLRSLAAASRLEALWASTRRWSPVLSSALGNAAPAAPLRLGSSCGQPVGGSHCGADSEGMMVMDSIDLLLREILRRRGCCLPDRRSLTDRQLVSSTASTSGSGKSG